MSFDRRSFVAISTFILVFAPILAGCATRQQMDNKNQRISKLKAKVNNLQAKNQTMADSHAAEVSQLKQKIAELQKKKAKLKSLAEENKQLKKEFSDVEAAKTKIERDNLVITVNSSILFDLGEANLKPESKQTLDKIADAFSEHPNRPIAVEGHTDTLPITRYKYPTNWHLASDRSISVIRYFWQQHEMNPERFIAASFSQYHPVATNNTEEGRQKNRRVEIVLYPPGITGNVQADEQQSDAGDMEASQEGQTMTEKQGDTGDMTDTET